jgi:hypothetical protein
MKRACALIAVALALPVGAQAATPEQQARNVNRAIALYFPTQYEYARAVASCESNLYRWATGSAGERGLFQIHPSWFGRRIGRYVVDADKLYQPWYNAKIAAELVRVSGWHHWACA